MTEVPEIYALRRNHDDIVGAMSHNLDYFKRRFVQGGFIRPSDASDIMGRLVAGPTDCCVGTVRIVPAERKGREGGRERVCEKAM